MINFNFQIMKMAKAMKKSILLADEVIMNKIYIVRGQKVMIDRDLAEFMVWKQRY